jgi:TM2 domain-containing membrane protein YozV
VKRVTSATLPGGGKLASSLAGLLLLLVVGLLLPASVATAGDDAWLEQDDWRQWLGAQDFGGRNHEFEAVRRPGDGRPSDLGRRLKAGALSLAVPGAGQFYNGDRGKALVMVGVEAAIWGTYLGFHHHAGNLSDDYRNWAGTYAGTSGDQPDNYWQSVGRFQDSDAWYESQLRQARAFGEDPPPPPSATQQWQWRSNEFRVQYQDLRADANRAYDRRDKMLLFALLSRAVSVFDAVRNGGQREADPAATTGTRLLGADVALEVSPIWSQPAARATASWSF